MTKRQQKMVTIVLPVESLYGFTGVKLFFNKWLCLEQLIY